MLFVFAEFLTKKIAFQKEKEYTARKGLLESETLIATLLTDFLRFIGNGASFSFPGYKRSFICILLYSWSKRSGGKSMLMTKIIEISIPLFHILALVGCGHFLQEGKISSALECAVVGSLCIVMLASADVLANSIKGKGG